MARAESTGGMTTTSGRSVLVTPSGVQVGSADPTPPRRSGGRGSRVVVVNQNERVAEELTKLGRSTIQERQELASQVKQQLARRDLTREDKLKLKREFQSKLLETEKRKLQAESAIRGGKSFAELNPKPELQAPSIPKKDEQTFQRPTIQIPNPALNQRRTIDINEPKYIEVPRVDTIKTTLDIVESPLKVVGFLSEVAGEKAEKLVSKIPPEKRTIFFSSKKGEYPNPVLTQRVTIDPTQPEKVAFGIPARALTISPKRVGEGVEVGSNIGMLITSPTAVVAPALIVEGTRTALTAPTTTERVVGIAETGLGVFGLGVIATRLTRGLIAGRTPRVLDVQTRVASPNVKTIESSKVVQSLKSGDQLAFSREKLTGARVYASSVKLSDGSKRTYEFLELGKAERLPSQLMQGSRKIYGAELDSKGEVLRYIGSGTLDVSGKKLSRAISDFVVIDLKRRPSISSPFGLFKTVKKETINQQPQYFRLETESQLFPQKKGSFDVVGVTSQTREGEFGSIPSFILSKKKLQNVVGEGSGYLSRITTSAEISSQTLKSPTSFGKSFKVTKKGIEFGRFGQQSFIGAEKNLDSITFRTSRASKGWTESKGTELAQVTKLSQAQTSGGQDTLATLTSISAKLSSPQVKIPSEFVGLGLYEQARFVRGSLSFPSTSSIPLPPKIDFKPTMELSVTSSQKLDVSSDTGVKIFTKTSGRSLQKTIQKEDTSQDFIQSPNQLIAQKPNQQFRQDSRQTSLLKQNNALEMLKTGGTSLRGSVSRPQNPRFPKILIPLLEPPSDKRTDNLKDSPPFKIFGKRFGKDIEIGKAPSQAKAEEKLTQFLKGTLGRSGFITKEGVRVKSRLRGFEFRPSKVDPFRVVQKRKFSLGTGSEVGELQFFKRRGKRK